MCNSEAYKLFQDPIDRIDISFNVLCYLSSWREEIDISGFVFGMAFDFVVCRINDWH